MRYKLVIAEKPSVAQSLAAVIGEMCIRDRRYSMLKTFAGKYRTRIRRIIRKYRQGKDCVVEYPKKNGKVGKVLFYNNVFRLDTKVESGNPDIVARIFENYGRNSLITVSYTHLVQTVSERRKCDFLCVWTRPKEQASLCSRCGR